MTYGSHCLGRALRGLAGLSLAAASAGALADTVYQTGDPFGGPFGLWGIDVFEDQSAAVRFIPEADYTLDRISLWFMNNDFGGQYFGEVTISLRDDDPSGGNSIPGSTIYESWKFQISAVGWDPKLEVMDSTVHPALKKGVRYWVVAESPAPGGIDPVWNFATNSVGFMANTDPNLVWYPGGSGAVACTIVEGTPDVLQGDLTGDGKVNQEDLGLLLAAYGTCVGQPGFNKICDIDGDGCVGQSDLGILLADWTG